MRTNLFRHLAVAALPLAGALLLSAPLTAQASTSFGTLSNFDVFNDTGEVAHGFEIELDGITSADITYKFGAPYERYGNPVVTDFPGGVYVRYESPYDAGTGTFTQGTPLPPSPITPTGGHACWTGGMGANYATAGCEHFGLGLTKNATNTVYRWLVADPASPGSLKPAGTNVSIQAPVWNVSPAPVGAPNPAPVVRAVIPPPPPAPVYEFGDAQWVKVYVTESPNPAELRHLLSDDPAVPQDQSETETEWVLMQEDKSNPGANDLANEAQMGNGNESVTRRYEFYKYTGAYDPETHEALPVDPNTPDPADLGDYIGAQMAAVNIAPAGPADAILAADPLLPPGEKGLFYSQPLVSGGAGPFTITRTGKGRIPAGLVAGQDGTLSGTPTRAGTFPFTVHVADSAAQAIDAPFTASIAKALAIAAGRLPAGTVGTPYSATVSTKPGVGVGPFSWSVVAGVLPDGLTLDPATGEIAGTPTTKVKKAMVTIQVTDDLGAVASRTYVLRIT